MTDLLQFWQLSGGWIIGATLAAIFLGFMLRFVLPAWQLDRELRRATDQLRALPAEGTATDHAQFGRDIMATPHLRHLWREFAQTLHRYNESGQPPKWRTTAMASQFFTEQALVDTPLKTGFYKHLPGILTGIGIIGTFSGLIVGLGSFQVSRDTEAVRSSLHDLILSVGHAFEISAVAITLAMLFTWIEKFLSTRLYRRVEELCQALDSLFESGVGEEYLARLVRSSEAALAQGKQFNQALVGELRQSMAGLLAQQQAAAVQQQQALAKQLGEELGKVMAQTMAVTLHEPLQRMTLAIEKLGSNQGATLGQALAQTLQRFSQQIDQTFGQRQNDLENLLAKTSQSLASVATQLGSVSTRLEAAGQGAFQSAAGQLQNASGDVQRSSEAFTRTSNDMAQAAAAMTEAAKTASQSLIEQGRLQESIARMVADLRGTVETARRDAALTSELVSRLENGADALVLAETRASDYLLEVNEVLGQAHAAFADNVEKTLTRGNSQFQRSVVSAVEALEGAIEELSDTLASEPR